MVRSSVAVAVVEEECANAIPAGNGSGADFLFGDHLIGRKKDQAEINERGGSLATHATGGGFAGESGERVVQVDFGNTFAHEEGLELEKKIFPTRSTRRKSGVMEAEAVVGRMSGLCAVASINEREAAEGSVGEIDALARHGQSLAVSKAYRTGSVRTQRER
jgi:hypothetical protein